MSCSQEILTHEDHQIFALLMSVATQGAYHKADRRDFAAMFACRRDRDALDREEHGLSDACATRIHLGFLAFRELAL